MESRVSAELVQVPAEYPAQARRFVDDTGSELGSGVTYLFRNIPNSPRGVESGTTFRVAFVLQVSQTSSNASMTFAIFSCAS